MVGKITTNRMTVRELIEKLKGKNQDDEIEYVVVKRDGQIIAALVEKQVSAMQRMLKLFEGDSDG